MARVVLIDDHEQVRALYKEVLEDVGYEVSVAQDGVAGLRLVEDGPPDVVVCDIFMPEKTGIEVAVELHDRFPDLPVILISGVLRGAVNAEYLTERVGAMRMLEKPVSPDQLVEALREALGTKDASGDA